MKMPPAHHMAYGPWHYLGEVPGRFAPLAIMANPQLGQVPQRLTLDPEFIHTPALKGISSRRHQLLVAAADAFRVYELDVHACVCPSTPDVAGVGHNLTAGMAAHRKSCKQHAAPFLSQHHLLTARQKCCKACSTVLLCIRWSSTCRTRTVPGCKQLCM